MLTNEQKFPEKFHQEWMDQPIVIIHEHEATQLHLDKGKVYLASRYKNGEGLYQKWHVPVKRSRSGGPYYLGKLNERRMTTVMLGANIDEAKKVLQFFLDELGKMDAVV